MLTRRTGLLMSVLAGLPILFSRPARAAGQDEVIRRALQPGVSARDAADSMKQRAASLNIRLVGEMPLSDQVTAMTGTTQRHVVIYQFCDPMTAQLMVDANVDFAAFMPCRIALAEDAQGKFWLVMTNLDALVAAAPPQLQARAQKVRQTLLSILDAGATGDL